MSFACYLCLAFVGTFAAGQSVDLDSGEKYYNNNYFIPRNRRAESEDQYMVSLSGLFLFHIL